MNDISCSKINTCRPKSFSNLFSGITLQCRDYIEPFVLRFTLQRDRYRGDIEPFKKPWITQVCIFWIICLCKIWIVCVVNCNISAFKIARTCNLVLHFELNCHYAVYGSSGVYIDVMCIFCVCIYCILRFDPVLRVVKSSYIVLPIIHDKLWNYARILKDLRRCSSYTVCFSRSDFGKFIL